MSECVIPRCTRKPLGVGFCKVCYEMYASGIIRIDGKPAKPRIGKYEEGSTCEVDSCSLRPESRGFCRKHRKQIELGLMDWKGKPLPQPAWKAGFINKGQICDECDNPAYMKGKCSAHYAALIRPERKCKKCSLAVMGLFKRFCQKHEVERLKALRKKSRRRGKRNAEAKRKCQRCTEKPRAPKKKYCEAHYKEYIEEKRIKQQSIIIKTCVRCAAPSRSQKARYCAQHFEERRAEIRAKDRALKGLGRTVKQAAPRMCCKCDTLLDSPRQQYCERHAQEARDIKRQKDKESQAQRRALKKAFLAGEIVMDPATLNTEVLKVLRCPLERMVGAAGVEPASRSRRF